MEFSKIYNFISSKSIHPAVFFFKSAIHIHLPSSWPPSIHNITFGAQTVGILAWVMDTLLLLGLATSASC
jgi:hypothetical protein